MEQEVIDEIIHGNRDLFKIITKEYYHQLYVYIFNQILNQVEAFDLTQEVFIKIYQNLSTYDPNKASFKNWVYKIATNYCMDYFRSKHYKLKKMSIEINDEMSIFENILEDITNQESITEIISIINHKLKTKQRLVIHYFYFAELEVKEIANLLHIPIKTVYSILDLSIKKIKKEMEGPV